MMIYPPITKLVEKTGSRYTLVIETAKRARQLVAGAPALVDVDTNKEVTVAVNEIYEGRVEAVNVKELKNAAMLEANGESEAADAAENSEAVEITDSAAETEDEAMSAEADEESEETDTAENTEETL